MSQKTVDKLPKHLYDRQTKLIMMLSAEDYSDADIGRLLGLHRSQVGRRRRKEEAK